MNADSIIVSTGKTLKLSGTVTVNDYLELSGTSSSPTFLTGTGSNDSLLVASGNLCFEYLTVSNVNAGGGATFNARMGSVNSGGNSGWIFDPSSSCAPALNADFSADATTVCEGTTVTFTDASTGSAGINSWNWDFGDGTTSSLQTPTHTYATAGTYDVSLTVNGSADTETKTGFITVNANPTVSAGADQNGCSSTYYTFSTIGQWNPYADFNAPNAVGFKYSTL